MSQVSCHTPEVIWEQSDELPPPRFADRAKAEARLATLVEYQIRLHCWPSDHGPACLDDGSECDEPIAIVFAG